MNSHYTSIMLNIDSSQRAASEVSKVTGGTLDILINNAARIESEPFALDG